MQIRRVNKPFTFHSCPVFSNPVEFALLNMYSCKMLSAYLIRISHYMIKLLMSQKTANEDLNKFQQLHIKNMPWKANPQENPWLNVKKQGSELKRWYSSLYFFIRGLIKAFAHSECLSTKETEKSDLWSVAHWLLVFLSWGSTSTSLVILETNNIYLWI